MGVVIYRCDTCSREKMFTRNIEGLEHIGRCHITLGCRGKLLQQRIIPGYIRGEISDTVLGLDDWYPRKVLHEHSQTIDSEEWVVKHEFGTNPAVVVFVDDETTDSGVNEITPEDIEIVSPDTLILKFDKAYSGIAQLIARQSDPDLFKPILETEDEEESVVRITYEDQLSIGTRISSLGEAEIFRLKMTFKYGDESAYETVYEVDNNPEYNSPWSDYEKISLKGKIFTVRSFNFINEEMGDGKRIKSGSKVYFTDIDPGTGNFKKIEKDEVVILLANDPYKSVDKNKNLYVDCQKTFLNQTALFYNSGIIYALPEIVTTVFPPIQSTY